MTPDQALRSLMARQVAPSDVLASLGQAAHARAFTLAGVASRALIGAVRSTLELGIREGWSLVEFQKLMTERLAAGGWLDVRTKGGLVSAPWRLETIFRTNAAVSFATGRFQLQEALAKVRPYWQYITAADERVRPAHAAMHGRVWRADDPIWKRIYPPNGYNCRCQVRALTQEQVEAKGLKVSSGGDLPEDFPDAGWNHNPAQQSLNEVIAQGAAKRIAPVEPPLPIEALVPFVPPPHLPPPVTPPPPPTSLEPGGVAPRRLASWDQYRATDPWAGDDDLRAWMNGIHDPDFIWEARKGGYYSRAQRAINMGTSTGNRYTWRHEMGHYLDHRQGQLLEGRTYDYGSGLLAGEKAMKAAAKRIEDGVRTMAKAAGNARPSITATGSTLAMTGALPSYIARGTARIGLTPRTPEFTRAVQAAARALEARTDAVGAAFRLLPAAIRRADDDASHGIIVALSEMVEAGQELGAVLTSLLYAERTRQFGALSDLVGALTGERVGGYAWGFGHGTGYYKRRGRGTRETEAFANTTDLLGGRLDDATAGDLWSIAEFLAPSWVSWFRAQLRRRPGGTP